MEQKSCFDKLFQANKRDMMRVPSSKVFTFLKAENDVKSLEELFLSDICSTLSLKQKLICKSGLSLVPKSVNSTSHSLNLFLSVIGCCAYCVDIL